MTKRKRGSEETEFERWWERTWGERHDELERVFGPTEPPGIVTSFSWKEPSKIIPGACAMTFPPRDGTARPPVEPREDWLYVTHGLTQPRGPDEVRAAREAGDKESGYGWEFGFVLQDPAKWAPTALYWLLTYLTEEDANRIDQGHRVPIGFARAQDGDLAPVLFPQADSRLEKPAGALLFWPLIFPVTKLATSTGSFGVLVGTYITGEEYVLARATSSAHLLVLLKRAGIGQRSDPLRETLIHNDRWAQQWDKIKVLEEDEAVRELLPRIRGA